MPPVSTGNTTPWLSAGVFLIAGTALICIPEYAMVVVFFLPALYCIFAGRFHDKIKNIVALLPVCLGFIPAFTEGALMYGVIVMCGIIMWKMLMRNKIGMSVSAPTILSSAIFIIMLAILARKTGTTIDQAVLSWVKAMMDNFLKQYSQVLEPADIDSFNAARPVIESWITRLFPSIVVIGTAMIMWFNLVLASKLAIRVNLSGFSCPLWVIAVFILASLTSLVPYEKVSSIGLNILLIACIAYFFQGLSVLAFMFDAIKMWAGWRIIFYLLIITQMYIMIITMFLGLFDNWFYFRKRIKNKGDQA